MDALKWLLNASLILAFMFLGLKAQPNKDKPEDAKPNSNVTIKIFG